jgi:hypothetical protein
VKKVSTYVIKRINRKTVPWEILVEEQNGTKKMLLKDNEKRYGVLVGNNFYGIDPESNDLFQFSGIKKEGSVITLTRVSQMKYNDGGYPQVFIKSINDWDNIHEIIAYMFCSVPDSRFQRYLYQVSHKDRNKNNNSPSNLEYVVPVVNSWHEVKSGNPNGLTYFKNSFDKMMATKDEKYIMYCLQELQKVM